MTRDIRDSCEVQKENLLNVAFLIDRWKKIISEMSLIFTKIYKNTTVFSQKIKKNLDGKEQSKKIMQH